MKNRKLGRTGLDVSEFCLGTMTYGTQTDEQDAHAQIDMSLDSGINFIDTAEMYPVTPLSAETQGDTERIVGSWIAATGRRSDIVLATKVTGKGYQHIRGGDPISPETIEEALNNSLKSLQTDYIDLYQLHWPNRGSYMFRQNWSFDPTGQDSAEVEENMVAVLEALSTHVKAGKIRHIGLSNESTWGTMSWLSLAEKHNLPRMESVQNEYSLLCRFYDLDMAEMTQHEQSGLLAFSPLAGGMLTGKYQGNKTPTGSRRTFSEDMHGRVTPRVWSAIDTYLDIARKHSLDPVHMALAFCKSRPFTTSVIIGARNVDQLKVILAGKDIDLSEEVLGDIAAAHKAHPMPY
jgi:aryl-alcohol dehydrogenase-like predicted oxidoreductase